MPSYIVKVNKEDDLYVYWSDIVESPHCWGSRTDVANYMKMIGETRDIDARFARADEHGTSAHAYAVYYGWDDSGFIVQQKGFLPRKDLLTFLRSYDTYTGEFDETLLEPFDDDEGNEEYA